MKIKFCGLIAFSIFSIVACQSNDSPIAVPTTKEVKLARGGKEVFSMYCVACHGADGKMAFSGATDLSASTLDLDTRILQITYGKGVMNAFKKIISEDEIKNVALYIEELRVE